MKWIELLVLDQEISSYNCVRVKYVFLCSARRRSPSGGVGGSFEVLLARGGFIVVDHIEDELFQFSLLDESLDLPLQMEALGG